jgi:hypothetical protein
LFLKLIGCLYVFQFQNKLFSAESYSFSFFIKYCISLYLYIKFTLFLFYEPPIINDGDDDDDENEEGIKYYLNTVLI